jgi:hypothetical protein
MPVMGLTVVDIPLGGHHWGLMELTRIRLCGLGGPEQISELRNLDLKRVHPLLQVAEAPANIGLVEDCHCMASTVSVRVNFSGATVNLLQFRQQLFQFVVGARYLSAHESDRVARAID